MDALQVVRETIKDRIAELKRLRKAERALLGRKKTSYAFAAKARKAQAKAFIRHKAERRANRRKWSPEQKRKFKATMAAKKTAQRAAEQPRKEAASAA